MADFRGTGVAVITPFDQNNQIDYLSLQKLLKQLVASGVDYLVALGTTAETPTLSQSEQIAVLEAFFSTVGDQIPIVIGAGGNNTHQVCQTIQTLGHRFQPAGFLTVCPYYNKPSQQGLFAHFKEIALHTDADVILYNVPGRTQVNLEADTTLSLANELENIRAIKESSGNISQCLEILSQKPAGFQLISGDDYMGLPLVAMGAEGVISVLGNAFPKQVVAMMNTILEGDVVASRNHQWHLSKLMRLCFEEGNPTGIKALCSHLGLCEGHVRLPLIPASEGLRVKIEKELAEFLIPTSPSKSSDQ